MSFGSGQFKPNALEQRFAEIDRRHELEEQFGFEQYNSGPERLGWLINMHSTVVPDPEWPSGRAGVDYYFLDENGETFRVTLVYSPYFYIACKAGTEGEVEEYLRRKFERTIERIAHVKKEDLKQPNHLVGKKRTLIQLVFRNVPDLLSVRNVLLPAVAKNSKKLNAVDTYAEVVSETNHIGYENTHMSASISTRKMAEAIENIIDIREYDVPYHVRVAIDLDIRVGMWYTAKALPDETVILTKRPDLVHRPEPVVLAFDIETTKLPLKFPDASIDQIMMISYMIDGKGYLITNREIVSQDIEDFEYTPKPEYEGPFTIFNEANEHDVIQRFFSHIQEAKPTVYVTYNGDFFDWPFVEARAKANSIDMYEVIGVYKDEEEEYKCKHASHMDAFRWVKRDSYLPQGSQGLKAVTTAKLGYNPMELDPEDMTRFASEQPQTLAQYSVSDAVATYYLYMKYVHPFIFSLCNIIPLGPDDVLRKGTGTLCELLLMVEAYKANVIMPNKHQEDPNKMYNGHLLESETYVGGHVEALEAGVFRSDIETDFKVDPQAAQRLIDQLDDALKFTLQVEEKQKLEDIVNYDEVRDQIKAKLEDLRDNPTRHETPLIYHLDVAAMYPNIILTNRLQPDAMIDDSTCATCEFNLPGKTCDRRLTWSWRGEYFPAKRNEYNMIQNQLTTETFPPAKPKGPPRTWHQLTEKEQSALLRKRLTDYCKKVYKKVRETETIERESIICQRENPFYIETVRAFRDRRYEYKGLHKKWKQNLDKAISEGAVTKIDEAKKMIVLYDSLQLAHKCILNSFYGYVMRKGARWHSLEMAGIVCLTGARIIQMARQLVERIGRPLELDTDGIWCILPKSFPETFAFENKNGKKIKIHYPCTMLNHLVHAKFTNHQYQTLKNPDTFEYAVHSENSIFFEIDGPYRAMILPASTFEDKLLKKRYAVFNEDGSLAELKGFEVKRRGELKMIKIFQSQIFKVFLEGKTLEECYAAVAKVADQWLDILYSKGANLNDEELFDLISENKSMSKTLEDYGGQKSTAICTAKRLAEFLGDQMVKDKGLACRFIISELPRDVPVSERAIPVTIFYAEPSVKKHYLRKWLKDNSLTSFDIRDILDWPYYMERFGGVIQKLITIPAAMQDVRNPVPRVRHPDWLFKRVAAKGDKLKQRRITDMFGPATEAHLANDSSSEEEEQHHMDLDMPDIEELGIGHQNLNGIQPRTPVVSRVTKRKRGNAQMDFDTELAEEDVPENMPDMYTDYSGWLEFQKRKWKRQRIQRAKRREMYGSSQPAVRNGVSGYFRRQTGSLVSSTWEILQIIETDTPGEFKMWVSIQQKLFSVRLSVPRIFYLNSRQEEIDELLRHTPSCSITKCVKTLPRSRPCLNLFEIAMTESAYQEERRKLSGIFNHPSTEGVYETQVPLEIRALLSLGSHCKVRKDKVSRSRIEDRFELLDLVPQTEVASKYFSRPKDYHYVYLHHLHSDNRHLFTLVGATLPEPRCFVVGMGQKPAQMPNVGRLYREAFNEIQAKFGGPRSDIVEFKDRLDIEASFHQTEREALKAINKALAKYQDVKRGPAIVVICSPRPVNSLIQHARMLTEFPFITLRPQEQENRLQTLSWLQPALKQALKSYLEMGTWVEERINQARYGNVPVGNIPDDVYLFFADLTFARRLRKNDMVLWWSPGTRPDLGGREDDENMYIVNELENPEITNPAAYHTVCIEIDMLRLCLNTLMEAPVINELEGTTGVMGFDNTLHSLDEYNNGTVNTTAVFGEGMISAKTFTMLRATVQQWFQEAIGKEDSLGELMLDVLHRWLQSPNANMHDPCLYGLVHGLMKKIFMQLVAEFKRLGASIVFANFHRIILATSKDSVQSAISYGEYLFRSVTSKQVFEVLDLRLVDYWELLVWMDEMNYGGIVYNPEMTSDRAKVTMQWNIEEYLPSAVKGMFQRSIASFILKMYQLKIAHPKNIRNYAQDEDEREPDARTVYLREYVRGELMEKLLRWVSTTLHKQDNSETYAFPQLTGSHLPLSNPTLECAKSICAVVSLDPELEDEARLLKRNALQCIGGMSDFAPEAQFINPCAYYKLCDVICNYCNYSTDLDFCRDDYLLPLNGQPQVWRCRGCHVEYDRSQIEETMAAQVQRWLAAYQLQDLRCSRCRTVKKENLMKQCGRCGGEFVPLQNKQDLIRRLRVFKNVAEEQRLTFLSEVVNWTLSHL